MASGWLGLRLLRALLQPPQPQALAAAAPAAMQADAVAAPDTASAAALPAAEPPQEIPADTAIRFAAYDPLAGDTLPRPLRAHLYVGTRGGRAIVLQWSVGVGSAQGS